MTDPRTNHVVGLHNSWKFKYRNHKILIGGKGEATSRNGRQVYSQVTLDRQVNWMKCFSHYKDKGRSILRFLFRASFTCFVIFMHKSNSSVTHNKITASLKCLKYKETPEKTKNAKITSSHTTKIATSTLEEMTLEVEEKNETEAQSYLDRI